MAQRFFANGIHAGGYGFAIIEGEKRAALVFADKAKTAGTVGYQAPATAQMALHLSFRLPFEQDSLMHRHGKLHLTAAERKPTINRRVGVKKLFSGILEQIVEAVVASRMASRSLLLNYVKKRVPIAVHCDPDDFLCVPTRFSFYPEFFAASAPIRGFARFQRIFQRFPISISEHQNLFGFYVLHNNRYHAVHLFPIQLREVFFGHGLIVTPILRR